MKRAVEHGLLKMAERCLNRQRVELQSASGAIGKQITSQDPSDAATVIL